MPELNKSGRTGLSDALKNITAAHAATFENLTETKILPTDGAPSESFGASAAISGTTALVGSTGDRDGSGAAYLFDTTTGTQLFKLAPDDGAAFDRFGISVALSGTTALVGSSGDDDNGSFSGSAYLYAPTAAPVPLPAGVWLLGSALGVLVLRRRRRTV